MEQIMMGGIVLAVVIFVRRKEIFEFRWQPDKHTWAAVLTGLLAAGISMALLWLDAGSTAHSVLLYGGIWVLCGVVIPWGYVLLVEGSPASALGLRSENFGKSIWISLGLAVFFSLVIIFQADFSAMNLGVVAKGAVVLIVGGGLFELFLYYGFIHLRLDKAFGPLPAIFLTSGLYVLWHIGTQLTLEADPWMAALKLFGVGIMYHGIFSLTHNLAIIWPFFFASGVMIDFLVNIGEMDAVSGGFFWTLGAVVVMALAVWGISKLRNGQVGKSE